MLSFNYSLYYPLIICHPISVFFHYNYPKTNPFVIHIYMIYDICIVFLYSRGVY